MSKEYFAHTSTSEQAIYLSWKIDNFLDLSTWQKSPIFGPDVIMPTQPETTWTTFIEIHNYETFVIYTFRAKPVLSFRLPEFKENFKIACELSFRDPTEYVLSEYKDLNNSIFYIREVFACNGLTRDENVSKLPRDIHSLLVDNDLVLNCCFKVIRCSTGCHVKLEVSSESSLNCLSDNFRTLYSSKTLSDFTIIVKDKLFPVHKCILSSRSSVFAAMFNSDTWETNNNKLIIEDFDIKTIETFILYIYTGQLCELPVEEYFQLYSLADKYALKSLNTTCVQKLINCVCVDNACDVYALGYYHSEAALKSSAIAYISKNVASVLTSKSWGEIISRNSKLASEILAAIGIL